VKRFSRIGVVLAPRFKLIISRCVIQALDWSAAGLSLDVLSVYAQLLTGGRIGDPLP
jgi:hypothetical protein